MVMRSEEECSYDLIVDMGIEDGTRAFETIQVKTSVRTSSRPISKDGITERVSVGGKPRNSYWYYDEDVTYIATVVDNEVVYWHKKDYLKKSPAKLKSSPTYDFPLNASMVSYRRVSGRSKISETLEDFFG
tara:strand:- start:359 stop:751 length:393 start_codon:yes stop_codon:yes gene_type:complete